MAQLEDPVKITFEHLPKRAEQRAAAKRAEERAANVPHRQADMGNQFPQAKKPPWTVIDSNEAANLFGGVVLIDYGRKPRKPPGTVIVSKDAAKIYGGAEFIKYYNLN